MENENSVSTTADVQVNNKINLKDYIPASVVKFTVGAVVVMLAYRFVFSGGKK